MEIKLKDLLEKPNRSIFDNETHIVSNKRIICYDSMTGKKLFDSSLNNEKYIPIIEKRRNKKNGRQ